MPLSNQKHELFAQNLAKGKTADEAYVLAGYRANRGNATTLKANQSVLERVAELKNRGAQRAEVTVASLLLEAEEVREKALAAGQYAPAIAAIKEKGILAGVRVEKRENANRTLGDMSDDELADIARSGGDRIVAPTRGPALTH